MIRSLLNTLSTSLATRIALLAMLAAGLTASSQAQGLGPGIRYTFAPVGGYLYESDNSALQSEATFGGELGIGFGRYLQVSGEYLLSNDLTTNLGEFESLAGLAERSVDLRRYGGRLRLNLSGSGYIPYLSAGTGILEFNPESVDKTESIYATVGAGFTFRLAQRYRVSLGGELLSYRYDPVSTFVGQDIGVEVGERTVYSPSLRASVELFLGGRSLEEQTAVDEAFREQFSGGLSGIRLTVDPFYGRLQFNEALGFPKDQNLYGVNAGIDLGPYVGLRGFYWRGTTGEDVLDDISTDFEDIQLYGGELKLRLRPKRSRTLAPYGLIGGGYLDALSGYEDDIPAGTTPPEDRFFATGGVGLEVPLTRSLLLVGDVRSLLMSGLEVDEVSTPSEVYGSLMYSVGVEFNLGGGRDRARRPAPQPAAAAGEPAMDDPTVSPREAALIARIDSLEQSIAMLRQQQQAPSADTSVVMGTPEAPTAAAPSDSVTTVEVQPSGETEQVVRASNLSGQTIMLPVPEVGEIYVRFGDLPVGTAQPQTGAASDIVSQLQGQAGSTPASGLTVEQIQQIVRSAVQGQMQQIQADTTGQMLTQQQVERTVRQTLREYVNEQGGTDLTTQTEMQRLEEQIEALRDQIRRQSDQPAQQPDTRVVTGGTQVVEGEQPFYRSLVGRPLQGAFPVLSVRGGEGPTQALVGVRGDYRSRAASRFRLLPEVMLGFGNGATSISILGNVSYTLFRDLTERNTELPLEPYVGLGLGIASPEGLDLEFVGNAMLGVDYRLNSGNFFFAEYSTLDVFDYNRFSLGYRIRF